MHKIALFVTLAVAASLFGQEPSSYRITHTYMLGGDGGWDYIVPDHRITVCSSQGKTA